MGPEEPRPGYQDLGLGEDPPALNSPLDHPQASWRSERRSRTTVRSAALPNSPTPTAWWPSGGQRTSIGEAGAGRGGALGRHGLRSPPRQRPQGAGRREAGTVADPADRPSFLPRPTERGWRRAARSPYPFIAPGSRGRGARRPRRQPDALPWRTPRACGQERGEHRNARRTHGLRRCPPE